MIVLGIVPHPRRLPIASPGHHRHDRLDPFRVSIVLLVFGQIGRPVGGRRYWY